MVTITIPDDAALDLLVLLDGKRILEPKFRPPYEALKCALLKCDCSEPTAPSSLPLEAPHGKG